MYQRNEEPSPDPEFVMYREKAHNRIGIPGQLFIRAYGRRGTIDATPFNSKF
jgi:hypothetical protein